MADARSGAELADYSKVAFSVGGVRQEISIDDWRNGWAAIVGGLNGKPTSQHGVLYSVCVAESEHFGCFGG